MEKQDSELKQNLEIKQDSELKQDLEIKQDSELKQDLEIKQDSEQGDDLKYVYTEERFYGIMDMTQGNLTNMIHRLSSRKMFSEFMLIYYSIGLIIYTITAKYYPVLFDKAFLEYSGLILSIVILIFSIINQNANYAVRIMNAETALNNIKTLKREFQESQLEQIKKEYHDIVRHTEMRSELDFFITLINRCKAHGIIWFCYNYSIKKLPEEKKNASEIVKLKNYLSEINICWQAIKVALIFILEVLLVIIPVLVLFVSYYICKL